MKSERIKTIAVCVLMLTFAISAQAARPGAVSCDTPISWMFEATGSPSAPAAFTDDGKGAYKPGVDGIFNSVIHGCWGSYDATLGMNKTRKRSMKMKLPAAIPGTTNVEGPPPSFAGGNEFFANPFINVRNITGFGYAVTPGVPFYTKMGLGYIKGPDGFEYDLEFLPFDGQCPTTDGLICVDSKTNDQVSAYQNHPDAAAWVKVTYLPRNFSQPWSETNTDQWIVEGLFTEPTDPPIIQRGTLFSKEPQGFVHRGQYSMPFRIRITALAPLP
jgi:hypothetical protein